MLGMKHLLASLGLAAALAVTATTAHASNLCAGLASYSVRPLIGGSPMDVCHLPARALLVVNTASECGFTPQYGSLEKLHQRYKARGLQVVQSTELKPPFYSPVKDEACIGCCAGADFCP